MGHLLVRREEGGSWERVASLAGAYSHLFSSSLRTTFSKSLSNLNRPINDLGFKKLHMPRKGGREREGTYDEERGERVKKGCARRESAVVSKRGSTNRERKGVRELSGE